jgi:hypothetical protein
MNKGNAGKGRPKGVPNKVNAALKEMILQAAEKAHPKGTVAYLTQQAQDNPTAFLSLIGRVLPMTVEGTGKDGAITLNVVTGVPRDD